MRVEETYASRVHSPRAKAAKSAVLEGPGSPTTSRAASTRQPRRGERKLGEGKRRGWRAGQEMGKAGVRPAESWGRRRGAPEQPFLRYWNLRVSASRPPAGWGRGGPGKGVLPAPGTPRAVQDRSDLQTITYTHVP